MKNANHSNESLFRHETDTHSVQKLVKKFSDLSEKEIHKLIHELEACQIELKLQNNEIVVSKTIAGEAINLQAEPNDTSLSGYYTLNEDRKIVGTRGVIPDISEHKKTEKIISESEQKFKNIFNNSSVGISITNVNGYLHVNKAFSQIIGYSEKELNLRHWKEFTYPDDINESEKNTKSIFKGKRSSAHWEKRYVHKNGNIVWVDISTTLQRDENGNPQFFITSIADITERKRAEDALKSEQIRLRTLIDNLPDSIYVKDAAGRKIIANPADLKTVGVKTEREIIGKTDIELYPGEIGQKGYEEDLYVLQTGKSIINREECSFNHKGEKSWILKSKLPLFDENGKTTGLVGMGHDITTSKNVMEELKAAKDKAEESDRLKMAFLANMSHEIRTPMNGILGFAELLKGQSLPPEERLNYIMIIEKSGLRMLNTINDIVDVAKIEAGQMNVNITETDINEQFEYLKTFFMPEAKNKNIELVFKSTFSGKDAIIKTDMEKFSAVLMNLIKNALKYSNSGIIEVGYTLKNEMLEFYVKDSGIGISIERQKVIFERFIQADVSFNRAYEGSGLGLTISKAYVEMLEGEIWLESTEGKGSTFFFKIPYHQVFEKSTEMKETIPSAQPGQMKKLKVLIAEDEPDSRKFLEILMSKICNGVLVAKNGIEAIELCRRHPDIKIILMDIRMPQMDGYEATQKIREFNNKVVIIAQTGNALEGDREKVIESGCNDYITKPIKRAELYALIEKYS